MKPHPTRVCTESAGFLHGRGQVPPENSESCRNARAVSQGTGTPRLCRAQCSFEGPIPAPCAIRRFSTSGWRRSARRAAEGYASSHNNINTNLAASAAPVFDHTARIIASVTVLGSEKALSGARTKSVARMLLECATRLSDHMGHSPRERQKATLQPSFAQGPVTGAIRA
ncbi:MAG: IclR family transcriptional regulator C-terminal domain-containing protein [Pararhodobacter sp.]